MDKNESRRGLASPTASERGDITSPSENSVQTPEAENKRGVVGISLYGGEYRIVEHGEHKGYDYLIVTLGAHPCAYVRVPESHPYYKKAEDYENVPVECHGGLTYADTKKNDTKHGFPDGRWIGWDYAHYGDYSTAMNVARLFLGEGEGVRRYTIEELRSECQSVIDQLIELEKEGYFA